MTDREDMERLLHQYFRPAGKRPGPFYSPRRRSFFDRNKTKLMVALVLAATYLVLNANGLNKRGEPVAVGCFRNATIGRAVSFVPGLGLMPDHILVCVPRGDEDIMQNEVVIDFIDRMVDRETMENTLYIDNPRNDVNNRGPMIFYASHRHLDGYYERRPYPEFNYPVHARSYHSTTFEDGLQCGNIYGHEDGKERYTAYLCLKQNGYPICLEE